MRSDRCRPTSVRGTLSNLTPTQVPALNCLGACGEQETREHTSVATKARFTGSSTKWLISGSEHANLFPCGLDGLLFFAVGPAELTRCVDGRPCSGVEI